ncbi:MAG: methyltransferase domain-containing protein [Xenococcaceae cyanobacterium MO_188.B29]|nr:methyltransferase domain-containing protein [Xenococcaceae cyanobacterium MO_188.B29]
MLQINFSEINIDKLENAIIHETGCHSQIKHSKKASIKVNLDHLKQQVKYIEGFINTAKSRTEIRTQWPQSLNRFPLILLRPLSFILLVCLKLLFKDQREVNFNILATLQQFLRLAENLLQQVSLINTKIDQNFQTLESSVTDLKQKYKQNFQILESYVINLEQKSVTNVKKVEYLEQQISYLKSELNQQKRLVANFLEEAKKRLSEPSEQKQLETVIEEESHLLDAFYVAFEDRFRGSREEIIDRQKLYLPYLAESKLDQKNSLILDIGCGRGEWLELLQDRGYKAKGIDLNRVMVEQCRARNLDAIEGNAVAYIKSLPDASLGAITGFHIIEHIPFEALIQLFDEALRVLHSGGLVIFETPNPNNILVGSCNFYFDPTHRNPLPSEMIGFVAESRGLHSVNIINLNPVLDEEQLQKSDLPKPLDRYFYGAQDYAIIGYKP